MPNQITPVELAIELDGPNPPVLLDVRESHELQISALPGIVHIPMNQIPARLGELDKLANIVVVCRVGGRSGTITQFLLANGFPNVRNLATGMNGWARTVDSTIHQY